MELKLKENFNKFTGFIKEDFQEHGIKAFIKSKLVGSLTAVVLGLLIVTTVGVSSGFIYNDPYIEYVRNSLLKDSGSSYTIKQIFEKSKITKNVYWESYSGVDPWDETEYVWVAFYADIKKSAKHEIAYKASFIISNNGEVMMSDESSTFNGEEWYNRIDSEEIFNEDIDEVNNIVSSYIEDIETKEERRRAAIEEVKERRRSREEQPPATLEY
ncbi:MAG: hypothetical protein JXR63_06485 [Spirochaetales bacterium]|nr:hypothetical protein [Spirochaetales bacterium]